MQSVSHCTINCSISLLKEAVRDIGLRSSSFLGEVVFAIGVTYSILYCSGHTADCTILFNSLCSGLASSSLNSLTILLGKSPGITDRGFFAALSLT